jgi:hypothetical protein
MSILANATLQPDGVTLRLDQRIELPPGKVVVTVVPAPVRTGPTMMEVLDRIHRDRAARGELPKTREQIDAEYADVRADYEEEEARWTALWAEIDESKQKRKSADGDANPPGQ